MRPFALAALLLVAGSGRAGAQPAACPEPAQPWAQASTVVSATGQPNVAAARVAAGQAVRLRLHPDGEVSYLTRPKGAGEAASFGGLALIDVAQPGTYRVALEKSAWVDVVEDGKPVKAGRFGRGAECSGVQKAVEFRLSAGPHVIELSGSGTAELGVLVTEAVP